MSKVLGKLISCVWNDEEIDLQNSDLTVEENEIDVTDNSAAGDSAETIGGLKTASLQISGVLKKDEEAVPGKDIKLTYGSITYPATSMTYEESFDEVETPEGGDEFTPALAGFATRKSTVEVWMKDDKPAPALGELDTATLYFADGVTAAGSLRVLGKGETADIRDAVKQSLTCAWSGAVTETALGLTSGEEGELTLIYKEGTGTNEQRTGTAVLMSKSISSDSTAEVKVTYTFRLNSIEEANYSAT